MTIQWGDGGDLQWETAMVGHIPSLAARFRIGIRVFFRWDCGSSEPHSLSSIPTFLLCVLCDRGPPTGLGLGSPDQGAEIRAQ